MNRPTLPTPRARGRDLTDADRYDAVARDAAASVIRTYSSSFGLASRLLHQPVRDHVRNVYAFVRLADEIVDGPMGVASPAQAGAILDRLHHETTEALLCGYSSNLIVHAFALTARECNIDERLVQPFVTSMRTDLYVRSHTPRSFSNYVFGSAEVVGLMCLRVFLTDGNARDGASEADLAPGAQRLGAAFQKINFLRDIGEDYRDRGRRYFPDIDPDHLTEEQKHRLLDDIDDDLQAALVASERLPDNSRAAVLVARSVFVELSRRLRQAPAATLVNTRVRVPNPVKERIALTTYLRARTS